MPPGSRAWMALLMAGVKRACSTSLVDGPILGSAAVRLTSRPWACSPALAWPAPQHPRRPEAW
eukprot:15457337-Alexandrium_andersonii.AAC.1